MTKALTGIPIDEIVNEGWSFLVILLLLAIAPFLQIALWLPQTQDTKWPVNSARLP